MRQMMIRILSLSLAVSLPGAAAVKRKCSDGGSGADMTAPLLLPTNFAGINKRSLQPTCTFSTCHSTTGARTSNKLNLQDDSTGAGMVAFAELVGQPAVNAKAAAAGLLRVKPCDATNSFLVTKLTLATTDPTRTTARACRAEPGVAGERHSGDSGLDRSRRAARRAGDGERLDVRGGGRRRDVIPPTCLPSSGRAGRARGCR